MRFLLCALAAPLVFTGCASIVSGHNQPLSVETRSGGGEPVIGAICKLSNDKGDWFVTTPGSATVRRSYGNLAVRCEKDPLDAGLASVASTTKGMAFGNILFGGVIGVGVDIGTGAAYDYPPLLTVVMGQAGNGIGSETKAVMAKTPAERAELNVAARRTAAELNASVQRAAAERTTGQPAAAVAVAAPSPAAVVTAVAPPAQPVPPPPAPSVPAAPGATVAATAPPPAAAPAPVTPSLPATYAYKYLYQAEHLPEVRACPYGLGVSLVAVSPGVEVYSAQCGRAEALMLRCEWGTCRILK